MSWRRTQNQNKRLKRGTQRSTEEIYKGIRKPIAPPTKIETKKKPGDWEYEWEDWDDGTQEDLESVR
jgi:hypothetical protein